MNTNIDKSLTDAIDFEQALKPANRNRKKPARHSWADKVPTSIRGVSLSGYLVLAASVAGFGWWAATAPLAGAVVAPGVIAASGQNQNVQHLEGGIIEEIVVSEGAIVKQGDALIILDRNEPVSRLTRLKKQLIAVEARAARLEAERDNANEFELPEALVAKAFKEGLTDDAEEQRREFYKRLERYKSESLILDQRIAAIEEQITGLEAQRSAREQQRALVLEELEHAKARAAKIYGEVVGYGATSDGFDMVAPSGEGAVRCMQQALAGFDGKGVGAPVDYINPHGTGTPVGDAKEIDAIRTVFGNAMPSISSTKSLTGHSLGAIGVQEAIFSLLMMSNCFVAESANIDELDPAFSDVPIARSRIDRELNCVLSNSFGFGGTNATLIFPRDG